MNEDELKHIILEIIKAYQPVKAKQIAHIINKKYNLKLRRKNINKVLYSINGLKDTVKTNKDFEWVINDKNLNSEPNLEGLINRIFD